MIGFGHPFGIHSGAVHLGNQLDERNQALVRQRPAGTVAGGLIGQHFDAMHDSARHGLSAFRTGVVVGSGFLRRQADLTVSVPVVMVLAFFRKKLDRPQEQRGIATRKGGLDTGERQVAVQHVGLTAKLARGMGIGVRDQGNAVELTQSPVHGRVRRQSGFNHVDMGTQFPETFFQRIKPRVGPEHRKMRRPGMRRDEQGLRSAFQHDAQQILTVQPQDGPSVGMEVADARQLVRHVRHGAETRRKDQIMHFARTFVTLINTADLGSQHEPDVGPA